MRAFVLGHSYKAVIVCFLLVLRLRFGRHVELRELALLTFLFLLHGLTAFFILGGFATFSLYDGLLGGDGGRSHLGEIVILFLVDVG